MSRSESFRFDARESGLRSLLGELEAAIMEVVWASEPTTVREVFEKLSADRELAYTTVMTVMSRLAQKGILVRRRRGQAHEYEAAKSREEFTRGAVGSVLQSLLRGFARPTLSQFVEFAREDEEILAELELLLSKKREGEP